MNQFIHPKDGRCSFLRSIRIFNHDAMQRSKRGQEHVELLVSEQCLVRGTLCRSEYNVTWSSTTDDLLNLF
jgi:hypothetical protein